MGPGRPRGDASGQADAVTTGSGRGPKPVRAKATRATQATPTHAKAGPAKAPSTNAKRATDPSASTSSAARRSGPPSRSKVGAAVGDGAAIAGEPASKRALRTQGRKTMRKLLDAAMVVFSRRGYHAARVDDIVKVARTSHGTFYLYFSNKEDLLRALVTEAGEVVASLDAALGPVGPGPDGWLELRAWMEEFSAAWRRYAPVLRAWTDLVMSDTVLTEQAQTAAAGVASTLARRVDEAGPLPGIDPHAAAEAVIAMVDRFHYLREFAGEPIDASAIDTLTTMVHRALFGGGDPPTGASASAGAVAGRRSRARGQAKATP